MIKNALASFRPSSAQIFLDKINIMLATIPVLIGITLYYFFGTWVYGTVMDKGQTMIKGYVNDGTMGNIVYYLVATILTIMLFFLINWTFVLIVSVIASPFNDMLSGRIEKKILGKKQDDLETTFKDIIVNLLRTLTTELKKVLFIIVLSIVAFIFGYIPILTPISVLITILLLAISFIDYSWSRHNIKFSACLNDVRKNFLGYALGGGFFFIIVSIPIINLIVPPLATSYFTILWLKNNESRH
jgi:CysZ protein